METGTHHGNIVLTGFMGTGKTTVGRLLAATLGREFVDTDEVIVARYGPIPAIFADHGEDRFRAIEREVAAEVAALDGLVIATGGRLLLDPVNAAALTATGSVVCLVADLHEILGRVRADGVAGRPLLEGPDPEARVRSLLEERADAYATFRQVDTTGRTPGQIVAEIRELLGL